MPYALSLTSRMVTIVATCALLLCVLLFLLGVEIGARLGADGNAATAPPAAAGQPARPSPAAAPPAGEGATSDYPTNQE